MAIVSNTVKHRLQNGKVSASFNVSRLRTPEVSQIAKACGFHWVFIDLEHSTMDMDTAGQICAAALPTGVSPLVRVPSGDINRAARILDAGAQGIIFPHVQNANEARKYVDACRFPPNGSRSLAYGGPQFEYQTLPASDVMEGLNQETLIIMMIETPEAVQNSADIAGVDGVDILLVGGSDLSATMGIPGKFQSPQFVEAIKSVLDATLLTSKWAGIGGVYDETILLNFAKLGIRFFLGGSDLAFILAGARARGDFFKNL